jgi:hypothetical protein
MILERGNNDQVILILMFASFMSLRRTKESMQTLGILALGLATYLKLFTCGAGVFLAAYYLNKREFLKTSIVIITQLTAIILLWPELAKIMKNSPTSPNSQFGIRSTPSWVIAYFNGGQDLNNYFLATTAIGCSIFLVSIIVIKFLISKSQNFRNSLQDTIQSVKGENNLQLIFLLFGGSFFAAFFAGSNWYYRFTLLIPVVFVLLSTNTKFGNNFAYLIALVFSLTAVGPTPLYLLSMQALSYILAALTAIFLWQLINLQQLPRRKA